MKPPRSSSDPAFELTAPRVCKAVGRGRRGDRPARLRDPGCFQELDDLARRRVIAFAIDVTLNVNGQPRRLTVEPRVTLLDALRENLGFTGTKKRLRPRPVWRLHRAGQRRADKLLPGVRRDGTTACPSPPSRDSPAASNCTPCRRRSSGTMRFNAAYCTSGQLCSAAGLLREGRAHTDADIRELMSGNLCRCGAYPGIVAAIREVRDRQPT